MSYMGMAAILVMWPGSFEQTFVPPSQGGPTWNLIEWPSDLDLRHIVYLHVLIQFIIIRFSLNAQGIELTSRLLYFVNFN